MKRLRGVALEVGQPLRLEIEVGGIPPPEVSWTLVTSASKDGPLKTGL